MSPQTLHRSSSPFTVPDRVPCLRTIAFLLAAGALILASAIAAGPPGPDPADLNADTILDTVSNSIGYDQTLNPLGYVQVISGATQNALYTIEGDAAGNGFGFAVAIADADPLPGLELFVSSPRFGYTTDAAAAGRVQVFAGVTGQLIRTITAPAGTRIGTLIAPVVDQDGDGLSDILVEGAVWQSDTWLTRTFLYSGRSGRLLGYFPWGAAALKDYAAGGGLLFSPADLDLNGSVDTHDLTLLMGLLGTTPDFDAFGRGDLTGDGLIDSADVNDLLLRLTKGESTIVLAGFVPEDAKASADVVTRWGEIYPGDPFIGPEGSGSGGSSLIVVGSPFTPPGNSNCQCGSGGGSGGGTTTFQGNAGGIGVIGQPRCFLDLAGCPGLVHVGDTFVIAPLGNSAVSGSCYTTLVAVDGDPSSIIEPSGGGWHAIGPGIVTIRWTCSTASPPPGCCGCAECTIHVYADDPPCAAGVDITNCPTTTTEVGRLSSERPFTFVARGWPPGGEYQWWWEPPTPGDPVESWSFDPDPHRAKTLTLHFKEHASAVLVVHVRYTISPGCFGEDECTVRLVADSDNDGLLDEDEPIYGTKVDDPDTDSDGVCDGCEVTLGTNPTEPAEVPPEIFLDTDHDGLSDAVEICDTRTDPYAFDTDGGGMQDMGEVQLSTDPFSPYPATGLPEYYQDMVFPERLDPVLAAQDADHDMLYDELERKMGLDPLNPDMDGDGIPDGIEVRDGTDPRVTLRHESGDTDHDGLSDYEEQYIYGTRPNWSDSDDDGLPDGFEVKAGLNPLSAYTYHRFSHEFTLPGGGGGAPDPMDPFRNPFSDRAFDPAADLDHDGLSNFYEYIYGTNPLNPDTDGDGVNDGTEIQNGTWPTDAGDRGDPANACGCWVAVTLGPSVPPPPGSPNGGSGSNGQTPPGTSPGGIGGTYPSSPCPQPPTPPDWHTVIANYCPDQDNSNRWGMTFTPAGGGGNGGTIPVPPAPGGWAQTTMVRLRCGTCYTVTIQHEGSTVEPGQPVHYQYFASVHPMFGCCIAADDPQGLMGNHRGPNGEGYDTADPTEGLTAQVCVPNIRLRWLESAGIHPQAGKLIVTNDGDSDGDAIPDFADGYNLNGSVPEPPPAPQIIDDDDADSTPEKHFVPIVLTLGGLPDPAAARFRFTYPLSNPSEGTDAGHVQVQVDPNDESHRTYTPGAGTLRLWRKDATMPRRITSNPATSDCITLDHDYSLAELGQPGPDGSILLYVEAVRPSVNMADLPISITLVGASCGDTALATAFGTQILEAHRNTDTAELEVTPRLIVPISVPTPTISLSQHFISNPTITEDHQKILATLTLSGSVRDDASDLIEGTDGEINQVAVFLNGKPLLDEDEHQIFISVTQQAVQPSPDLILHPFARTGTFQAVLGGIEVLPGWNQFEVRATNAYGFTGFAAAATEISAEPPPPEDLSIEIDFHGQDPYVPLGNGVATIHIVRTGGTHLPCDQTIDLDYSGNKPGEWFAEYQGNLVRIRVQNDTWPDGSQTVKLLHDGINLPEESIFFTPSTTDPSRWSGGRTIEETDLTDFAGWTVDSLGSSEVTSTDAGVLSPVLLEFRGPADLVGQGTILSLGTRDYSLDSISIGGTNRLLLTPAGSDIPSAFVAVPDFSHSQIPALQQAFGPPGHNGPTWFAVGYELGYADGLVVSFFQGLYQIGQLNPLVEYNRILCRLVATGSPSRVYGEERSRFNKVSASLERSGMLFWRLLQTEGDFAFIGMKSLAGFEPDRADREEMQQALLISGIVLSHLKTYFNGLDDYHKGLLIGKIVGQAVQIVVLFVPGLGEAALAVLGERLSALVTAVRGFDEFMGAAEVLNDLETSTAIAREATALAAPRVIEGGAACQRGVAAVDAIMAAERIQIWEALGEFLRSTNSPELRAIVDEGLPDLLEYVMRTMYEDAVRRGPEAMRALPKVREIKALRTELRVGGTLPDRFSRLKIQLHHVDPEYLLRMLIQHKHGSEGWTAEQVEAELERIVDEMPGLLVKQIDHTGSGLGSIHGILRSTAENGGVGLLEGNQHGVPLYDVATIDTRLQEAYRMWGRPEAWTVGRQWLLDQGLVP